MTSAWFLLILTVKNHTLYGIHSPSMTQKQCLVEKQKVIEQLNKPPKITHEVGVYCINDLN